MVYGEATLANRTVQLYKYIKLPSGWRYCKAVFYPNNRVKPHAVLTADGEQTIKDGYYCLFYNRKWEPVGNDPAEAVRLLMKKRGELLDNVAAVAEGRVASRCEQLKFVEVLLSPVDICVEQEPYTLVQCNSVAKFKKDVGVQPGNIRDEELASTYLIADSANDYSAAD